MRDDHSKYHSPNAFCGYADPEKMQNLQDLIDKLTDDELKQLVNNTGLSFMANEDTLEREDYEGVITEADREDFYREYKKIIELRKKK